MNEPISKKNRTVKIKKTIKKKKIYKFKQCKC